MAGPSKEISLTENAGDLVATASSEMRAAVREKLLSDLADRLRCAEQRTDKGEQFLRYEEIGRDIKACENETSRSIETKAVSGYYGPFLATAGGGLIGSLILSTAVNPALILISIPLVFVGMCAGIYGQRSLERRLKQEYQPFFEDLRAQTATASENADALRKNDLRAIAGSKAVSDVLAQVPSITEDFAAAFVRDVTSSTVPETAPQIKQHVGLRP